MHDADGNVGQKYKSGVYNKEYFWSAESQLDSVMQDSWHKTRYEYNAFGRIGRTWIGDPNGMQIWKYHLWDRDHLLLTLDASFQREGEYIYEAGTVDRPLATLVGAPSPYGIRYFEHDELGNVMGHTDHALPDNVNHRVSYDAWGWTTVELGSSNTLFWKGLHYEGHPTELYYMRNRWYDPESGRFMSEDPIGLTGGLNLYTFVGNDPINGSDPSGLYTQCITLHTFGYTISVGGVVVKRVPAETRTVCWNTGNAPAGDPEAPETWDRPGMAGEGLSASDAEEVARQIGRRLRPVGATLQCVDASLFLAGNAVVDLIGGRALARVGLSAVALHNASAAEYSAWIHAAGRPIAARITAAQDATATAGVACTAARAAGAAQAVSMAQGAGRGTIMNGDTPGFTDVFGGGTLGAITDLGRRCR